MRLSIFPTDLIQSASNLLYDRPVVLDVQAAQSTWSNAPNDIFRRFTIFHPPLCSTELPDYPVNDLTNTIDDGLTLTLERFLLIRSENAEVEELLVFCPTVADVDAMRASRILELRDGSLLMIESAPATPASESPKQSYGSRPAPLLTLSPKDKSKGVVTQFYEGNKYTSQSAQSEGHSAYQEHLAPDQYSNTESCSASTGATNASLSVALQTSTTFPDAAQEGKTSYLEAPKAEMSLAGYEKEASASDTLTLESYVIANHFKSLLRWAVETDSKSLSESSEFPFIQTGTRKTEKHGLVLRQTTGGTSLSWGRGSDSDSFGAVEEKEDERAYPCAILLMIDTRLKTYSLTIQAPHSEEVSRRIKACEELIASLEKMSYRITLTGADPAPLIP
jgi:hypothetical protein